MHSWTYSSLTQEEPCRHEKNQLELWLSQPWNRVQDPEKSEKVTYSPQIWENDAVNPLGIHFWAHERVSDWEESEWVY